MVNIHNLLMSTGVIIALSISIPVLVVAIVVGIIFLKKNKPSPILATQPKALNALTFKGNNTSMVQVVDIDIKKSKINMVVVPPTHWGILIADGITQTIQGGNCKLGEIFAEQPQSLKVVYVSKTVKLMLNWGTKQHQRIDYIDPQIGAVSIGAFGKMEVKIVNPELFYLYVVGNAEEDFTDTALRDRVLELTVDEMLHILGDTIREGELSYFQFIEKKYTVQEKVADKLRNKFADEYGFAVYNFLIENVNLPEEQEDKIKALETSRKDRAIKKEFSDADFEEAKDRLEKADYFKKKAREDEEYERNLRYAEEDRARTQRHEDEDRQWAREDKKDDRSTNANLHVADAYYDTVKVAGWENSAQPTEVNAPVAGAGRFCRICGSGYKPDDKYCPGCGVTLDKPSEKKKCPSCGAENDVGNRFCGNCNHKFE